MHDPAPHHRKLSIRLIAIVAALAMIFAACSSDDVEDAIDDGTDTADSVVDEVDEQTDEDAMEDDAEEAQDTLADTLSGLGLTSLASAVAGVDIGDLTDSEEYTFFAPNDEAFTSLTADELADLLADPEMLADVLRNHLIESTISSSELVEMSTVTSALGNDLDVVVDGETVMVGGATVVDTDQEVGDGVVHVIDGLLLPS